MTFIELMLIAILFLILFITWPIVMIAISINSIDKQLREMNEDDAVDGEYYYYKETKRDAS